MRNLLRANLWYWTHSVPVWAGFVLCALIGTVSGISAVKINPEGGGMLYIPQYISAVLALLLFLASLVLLAGKTHQVTDARRKLLAGYSRITVCISELLTASYLAAIAAVCMYLPLLVCGHSFYSYLRPKAILLGAVCIIAAYMAAAMITVLLTFAAENPALDMLLVVLSIPFLTIASDAALNLNDSPTPLLRAVYFFNPVSPICASFNTITCNVVNRSAGEFVGYIDTSYRLYTYLNYEIVLMVCVLLTGCIIYRRKAVR